MSKEPVIKISLEDAQGITPYLIRSENRLKIEEKILDKKIDKRLRPYQDKILATIDGDNVHREAKKIAKRRKIFDSLYQVLASLNRQNITLE